MLHIMTSKRPGQVLQFTYRQLCSQLPYSFNTPNQQNGHVTILGTLASSVGMPNVVPMWVTDVWGIDLLKSA